MKPAKIATYEDAIAYLYEYIPNGMRYRFPGDLGVKRTKHLLRLLGSPQNKLKVVHLAGTSGKGSTAYLTSKLLQNAGFKVGLHISPHLLDLRERFQVNNDLISIEKFCKYLNAIVPAIEKVDRVRYGKPTFFEVIVALSFYIFHKENVDYAVVETGLGGLYDGTNVVNRPDKLVVITRIGFDHMEILGNTLNAIASQKAGIIGNTNTVITLKQEKSVNAVIKRAAEKNHSKHYVIDEKNVKLHSRSPLIFDFKFQDLNIEHIRLAMSGEFQVENSALALVVYSILSKREHFAVDENKIRQTLFQAVFPGRMEVLTINNHQVIVDGAHNPQKMSALIKSLKNQYPDKKFAVLLAFKKGKDYKKILRYLIPVAKRIVITTFFSKSQGLNLLSEKPEVIAQKLEALHFRNFSVIPDTEEAVDTILTSKEPILVTGSLYLLSEVYPILKRSK